MTKLLTEQELREAFLLKVYPTSRLIEKASGSMGSSLFTVDELATNQLVDDLMLLVKSQKQAHADVVIGEDDERLPRFMTRAYKSDKSYDHKNGIRNQLRAEQRERNKS